ncbi:TAT-variant-translocated molybdopterin oxidoreductase [Flavobacteriales bacterium AH-315-E23]|nr:TAT-variant-translocated molybdopterin oxidoreductase [Flavobacteriales bacterium AH-315-E23]
MPKTKKYWKSTEELENKEAFIEQQEKEFVEELPIDKFLGDESLSDSSTSRRDFLKFLGFSVGAATLAACEGPVHKAVPYLNKPEEITPGVANWYASTYVDGRDYCAVLVKTREGRPIHIEGNTLSAVTKGAVNARVQGSVLPLYDSGRLQGPISGGEETSWSKADGDIGSKLDAIRNNGGIVRVLSSSLASSSTKAAIHTFLDSFQADETANLDGEGPSVDARHVVYDAVSSYGIRKANERSFGKAVVPSYHFEKAQTIVSVGADFLSNWVSPIESSHQYGEARKPGEGMAKHIQFEANLSLTGSNADTRIPVKPSQYGAILANIYNEVAKLIGRPPIPAVQVAPELLVSITEAANSLGIMGKAILVSGSNNPNHQVIANGINEMIGSYGKTIDIDNPNLTLQSDDPGVSELISDMNAGKVDLLVMYNVNPAYTLPNSDEFKTGLGKVGASVSFAGTLDETAALANYVCPDHHYLESWNDANPKPGHYSLGQPTISPLFKTRQAQDSLLKWAGVPWSYRDFIKKYWAENVFSKQSDILTFSSFWNKSLHDGVAVIDARSASDTMAEPEVTENDQSEETISPASALSSAAQNTKKETSGEGGWEIQLYEKTGLGDGSHANNPWLQELPDPVSKVCWDNYLTMNPEEMKGKYNTVLGQVQEADLVDLTVNGKTLQIPVYPQYGQAKGTVGLALGYGRTAAGKTGNGVGQAAYQLCSFGDHLHYQASNVTVSDSVGKFHIATTQTHHTMMGRDPVRATTLGKYIKNPKSDNPDVRIASVDHKLKKAEELNLWADFDRPGHHWGMSIDLNACIGCGACVVSCGSENNVSVVGKDEVRRSREMQWIRIDRYYSSEGAHGDYDAMEIPSSAENLEVSFQPIMCQHCNHAPCESVCPVAATTHSNDGLNQMVYNRCVGTKFCSNNCPYKVRRFNWFSYQNDKAFAKVNPAQDDMGRMVLNPDVVVRSRGVMEKCSMCIQRIQTGKLIAKKKGERIKDGAFQTACASACPTHAITFGDKNDPESQVSKNQADPRSYFLLEELNVQPTVNYMTKVRNKETG